MFTEAQHGPGLQWRAVCPEGNRLLREMRQGEDQGPDGELWGSHTVLVVLVTPAFCTVSGAGRYSVSAHWTDGWAARSTDPHPVALSECGLCWA